MDTSQFPYVDRPEVDEVYADSLYVGSFDGRAFSLTFAVSRLDSPDGAPKDRPFPGKRYTAARLVLSAEAAAKLQSQIAGLFQIAKTNQAAGTKN